MGYLRRPATLVLVVVLLVVGYGALLRMTFTRSYQGANDFFIPWYAVRALLREGRDPYSAAVRAETQRLLFGQERPARAHQFDFAYPLTLVPLLAPYVFLDYRWAQPLWQATVHGCLVAGALVWQWAMRRKWPRLLPLALGGLWLLSLYPAARTFVLGQVAALVFLAVAVAVWALATGRPGLAGAALAVATVKPQLAFLIVPLLLLLGWVRGQRRIVGGFAATLGLLGVLSLVLQPGWPLAFAGRLAEYRRYTALGAGEDSPGVLTYAVRGLELPTWAGPTLASAIFLGLLAWLWRVRYRAEWLRLGSVILLVSAWLAPVAATTDQVLLGLPLLWALGRLPRAGGWTAAALLWVLGWTLFLATVQEDREALGLRLLLPSAVSLLMLAAWRVDREAHSMT